LVFDLRIYRGFSSLGIDEINAIRSEIKGKNLSWIAGATSVSDLAKKQK